MKLTATYANSQGRLSKSDVERLLDNPWIVELDFVQDVMRDVINLYGEMRAKVFPFECGEFKIETQVAND